MHKFALFFFILISALQPSFLSSISAVEQKENSSAQNNWEGRLQNLLQTHGLLLNQLIEAVYYNKSTSDVDAIKKNLFNNGHDLATLFSSLLGNQAGKEFEPLFDGHIKLGGEYIKASKKDPSTKQQYAQQALANGNQVGDLFGKWFPSIPSSEWRKMFEEHVIIELQQTDAYFSNDINKGLAIKEESLLQLRQLGNMLIQGVNMSKSSRS